ncbi:MAG TPA: sulfotransferase [Anaerolineales bacterium]|nr:sulfotransferase [Anaerolineales bacterium]
MKQISFLSRKFFRRTIQFFGSHFYFNPDPDIRRSILVAGTARSGTTWLGDLIASQINCRILFEPFNPHLVPEYRNFNYFQYMRPGVKDQAFYIFAENLFMGKIRNHWVDRHNERITSEFRLIKEIRANLSLKWLHNNFPEIPIIFLLRHPCAVVSSRMELGWATDLDIEPFLSQPNLIEDHLGPYLDLIKNVKTFEEKHAIIWSVSNVVPLRQFQPGELKLVYYEDLCTQTQVEMTSVFISLGKKAGVSLTRNFDRPSQTTRLTSPLVTGDDNLSGWRKKMTSSQINNVLRIVDRFGLSHLYDDSLLPLKKDAP